MLRSLKGLERYTIGATDGDIGSVVNFLVDDEHWAVRYLVAETGGFFAGRKVLISPLSFRQADWATSSFHVQLTMEKVKLAPSIDVDQSVSRQHEMELSKYYQYPYYWGYAGIWGISPCPAVLAASGWREPSPSATAPAGDSHLRSVNEVCGYEVHGSDADVGHISDFIIDDQSWEVRYLVVATGHWWAGKRVLVAPHWAASISWDERKVYLNKSREEIRSSPAWSADDPINREYESRLYDYYGRPSYWEAPPVTNVKPVAGAAR
jgi:PRC-barrel domain